MKSLESTKKALTFWDESKAFAFKGNVIDLAIGVIIGAAFGKIIESLVKNVIMPLVSVVIPSEQSYTEWAFVLGDKRVPFGLFLGDVLIFLIVALVLWLCIVKFVG